ncbi:MAG: carotenoid 1,2-hydratase, partial [Sheuella sp.]|nr:carotenoid 1,2-hydratase [Sheuella sp.]
MPRTEKMSEKLAAQSTLRRAWLKRFLLLASAPALQSWSTQALSASTAISASSAGQASPAITASGNDLSYPDVVPRELVFPRDFGAHPDYRTEWWYMTGWLGEAADKMGFQVTFFRSRTLHPDSNPSRFAPRQLLFAHAALALPGEGQLRHAEVAGRAGPAKASFRTSDTALELSGWSLQRTSDDHYKIMIPTDQFTLELDAFTSQAPVLRGEGGYSSKGPSSQFASYYYSRPQLKVAATVTLKKSPGNRRAAEQVLSLSGSAWFDHEWSSSLMMAGAVGWDWIGINLLDGSSLMAFRMRDAAGGTMFSEWDWRDAHGHVIEKRQDVSWQPLGQWRSPRSLFSYPDRFTLRVADRTWTLQPLMSDQEVD